MIENKNLPAFPQPIAECNGGITDTMDYSPASAGISKREYFAGLAISGMMSNEYRGTMEQFAKRAVQAADALLAELSKPQP